MSSLSFLALLAAGSATAVSVNSDPASTLPDGVRAMIDAAIASGDAGAVSTMLRFARETQASAGAEIDLIEARWKQMATEAEERRHEEARAQLAEASILDNWVGQVEFGASRSTGGSSQLGAYGSFDLQRDGLRWRQKLVARAEMQDGRDVEATERISTAWQPTYKFDDRLYSFGFVQYESDETQGYDARYTAGGGFGYALIASDSAKLEIEGGPTFRHVDPTIDRSRSNFAARASVNLRWAFAPSLELTQSSALYLEEGERSAAALTAVDAKLFGPLKSRLSYDVRYESSPRTGGTSLNTLSRATLVYSF